MKVSMLISHLQNHLDDGNEDCDIWIIENYDRSVSSVATTQSLSDEFRMYVDYIPEE